MIKNILFVLDSEFHLLDILINCSMLSLSTSETFLETSSCCG